MARSEALTPGRVLRSVFFTFFGLALFSASLTVLFLGMRTILDVGGACASGGPYDVAVPCPDTAWTIPVSIFTGLFGLGIYMYGVWRLPGPNWAALAWPALFISLGWNFWEYGLDPPPGMDGGGVGFIVCGVVFVLMGGIPLVLILWNRDARRSLYWGKPAESDDDRRPRDDPARKLRLRDTYGVMRDLRDSLAKDGIQNLVSAASATSTASSSTAPSSGPIVTPPPEPPPPDKTAEAEGLADALERLAALRRRGDLSDAEFQAAKTRLIDEGKTP